MSPSSPTDVKALSVWLRELLERAGKNQTQIAQELGTDRRNVVNWLSRDKPTEPGALDLLAFLSAVGVTLDPGAPDSIPRAPSYDIQTLRDEVRAMRAEINSPGTYPGRTITLGEAEFDVMEQLAEENTTLAGMAAVLGKPEKEIAETIRRIQRKATRAVGARPSLPDLEPAAELSPTEAALIELDVKVETLTCMLAVLLDFVTGEPDGPADEPGDPPPAASSPPQENRPPAPSQHRQDNENRD